MINRTKFVVYASLGAMALGLASAAHAQDAAETEGGIQEIVVTAQKRSESINKVGMSINAYLTASALERGSADDRDEQLLEQLHAMRDEQNAQFAEFKAELTEAISATLAAELNASAARINAGLQKFTQWAEARWPTDRK